jgi:hypothetical protein
MSGVKKLFFCHHGHVFSEFVENVKGRARRRCDDDNIKTDLKEIKFECGVDSCDAA